MRFEELVKKTRSYRNFDASAAVSKETLLSLIELCRYTPSSANTQSIKFAYSCDKEKNAALFPLLRFAGYLTEKPPYDGNVPTAYILLCHDTRIAQNPIDIDAGICAQTLVLGAMEQGLGACMIGSFDKERMAALFQLPENVVPRLCIALGVPKDKIVITDMKDGDCKYWRDENRVHYVPKRPLDEILTGK